MNFTKVVTDLREIAEPSGKEFKTQTYVLTFLKALGFKAQIAAKTGVLLLIKGEKKETVAFRAELDALKSERGYAHLCGHDGHIALLLALASRYAQKKPPVSLLLIFQPDEEKNAGARRLLPYLKSLKVPPSAYFALHLNPRYSYGQVALSRGPMMAGSAEFCLQYRGASQHVAQETSPILAVSHLLVTWERLAKAAGVHLGLGLIKGGLIANATPSKITVKGSLRYYDNIDTLIDKLTVATHQQGMQITFKKRYLPVINDAHLADKVTRLCGAELIPPSLLAEDFGCYPDPYCYFFLGTGSKYYLHHPQFTYDPQVLDYGLDYLIRIINSYE